jgi:hypothetical protein
MLEQRKQQSISTVVGAVMHKKVSGIYDERAGNEGADGYQIGYGETSPDLPAISNTVTTLETPPFIGRFSAFSLMEKSGCRYEWRRERNLD